MGMSPGGSELSARLDDAKRDACLHKLGDHYAAGRLTAFDLDGRIQAALAADTEEELAAVMTDLVCDSSIEQGGARVPHHDEPARPVTRGVSRFRWAAALGILAVGGALSAVIGVRSDVAEFTAGVALGLLGFLTHWWLTGRPAHTGGDVADQPPTASPAAPVLADAAAEHSSPGEDGDAGPVHVFAPERARLARAGATRPTGRGDGLIPSQRTGD